MKGRTVLIIHPAWHSCGSHRVFCAQVAAYRALGARTISLSIGTTPGQYSRNRSFWKHYLAMTSDLTADERHVTGPSRYSFLFDRKRRKLVIDLLDGDFARQMAGIAELSPIPARLLQLERIDLIHCNHFFNMPLALKLKARYGAPVVLETHDIQARQYELRGAVSLIRKRRASFEEMIESELSFVSQADYLVHINSDEFKFFSERLPNIRHTLVYPAVFRFKPGNNDHFFLIVASANFPNYQSIVWFLDCVLPYCRPVRVDIVGNVDHEVRSRSPALFRRYRRMFKGRVESLDRYYEQAAAILLPTASGYGLSIKTVEALETGVPLIATPMAFRGMNADFKQLANVRIAEDPFAFAQHINDLDTMAIEETRARLEARIAQAGPADDKDEIGAARKWLLDREREEKRSAAPTRQFCQRGLSFRSYVTAIDGIASQALGERVAPRERMIEAVAR